MENSLETLAINLNLGQSELFKRYYEKPEIKQIHTFNDLSVKDLTDWYNSVLNKYAFLNPIQVQNFQNFWNSLQAKAMRCCLRHPLCRTTTPR